MYYLFCCCVTDDPKTWHLKSIYYLSVSQESGSGLAGCFWLRVYVEVAEELSARATVIWGLRILFQAHSYGKSHFLAGCWPETSVLCHVGLSIGSLGIPMAWQLASSRGSDQRENPGWKMYSFITLSQVAYHCFCCVLFGHNPGMWEEATPECV